MAKSRGDLHTVETIRKEGPYHFYEIKQSSGSTQNTQTDTGISLLSSFPFPLHFAYNSLDSREKAERNKP